MQSGPRIATLAPMPAFLPAARSQETTMQFKRSILMLAGLATAAFAQAQGSWPTRPITLVVPFAAGGPTDVVARTLGASMSKSLGQTVVIENKLGAGGTVAANYVAKAAPDGYTFFIHHNGMATAPALYRKLSFDPLKDFEFVSQAVEVPMTLLARKDFPANNLQEMITYVKANKEKINLATAGLGAVSQLCGLLFQRAIGVQLTEVPFQGTAPAMNALLGGQVDVLCDQTTQTVPQIKAGSVKLYGMTTRNRVKVLPNTPTLAEQGLKDFEVVVWHGIYAPKGTPKPIIDRMNMAVRTALKDPDVIKRMDDLGAEIVPDKTNTPEALHAWLKSEIDKYGPVIKATGKFAD
jgi:tripartite-type tricarboxylate transporter receptor subunit TctC